MKKANVSTQLSKVSKGIRAVESATVLASAETTLKQKKRAGKRLVKYAIDMLLK